MDRRTLVISALGLCGGMLILLGLILPWYPSSGRFTFSAFTLLANRQEGALLFPLFVLIFGSFASLAGGALAWALPRRDLRIVLLSGVLLSSLGVILLLASLTEGFNLTNPLPGLYVFTSTSVRLEVLLADMACGFYVSVAGITACCAGAVLSASRPRRISKRPRR